MTPAAIQWWMEQMALSGQNQTVPAGAGNTAQQSDINQAGAAQNLPGFDGFSTPNPLSTPSNIPHQASDVPVGVFGNTPVNDRMLPDNPGTFSSDPSTVATGFGPPPTNPSVDAGSNIPNFPGTYSMPPGQNIAPNDQAIPNDPGLYQQGAPPPQFTTGDLPPGFWNDPAAAGTPTPYPVEAMQFPTPAPQNIAPTDQAGIPTPFADPTNPAPNDASGIPTPVDQLSNPAPNEAMNPTPNDFYYPAGDGTYVHLNDAGQPIGSFPTQSHNPTGQNSQNPDFSGFGQPMGYFPWAGQQPIGNLGLTGGTLDPGSNIGAGPLPGSFDNLGGFSGGSIAPPITGPHIGAQKQFVTLGPDTAPIPYSQWVSMGSPGGNYGGPSAAPGSGRVPGGVQ